jgi:hypothetical protein
MTANQPATTQTAPPRQLTMRYAGGLVRHLGLQMYAGFVPAIAELVANAWDADASSVEVELPLGQQITDGSLVRVTDDGVGMSFDEINDAYLVLGRDRRIATGTHYTASGRRVMGRKGIGKLAGFGIAHVMTIETVKDGWLTTFRLDYEGILTQAQGALVHDYHPQVLVDRTVEASDDIQQGTRVTLSRLQVRRQLNPERFTRSMARRFSVFGDQFAVTVNNSPLAEVAEAVDFQFRFPNSGWNAEDIEGFGPIQWWVGFAEKPIQHEDARGISVVAHGKLVQRPFFFDISGGMQGQHGLQYMAGAVIADGLDESRDLIATDRATVLWEDPAAQALLSWGQEKVRELLREWSRGRRQANEERTRKAVPELGRVDRLPERARAELSKAVDALWTVETIDEDRLQELVRFLVQAYDNEHFMALVRELNQADAQVGEELVRLFTEWDVQEAVSLAWVVRGRVSIIRQFERMITDRVPEKPDMQDFVKEHPWLLGPTFDPLHHEHSLDRVIREEIGIDPNTKDGQRRLDFFTLASDGTAIVVELKRPGVTLTRRELRQLDDYVAALATHYERMTDPEARKRVSGVLIGSDMRSEDRRLFENAAAAGNIVKTWRGLLEETERLHREYLQVVRDRAPQDDPRLDDLDASADESEFPAT